MQRIKAFWRKTCLLTLITTLTLLFLGNSPALAGFEDDKYDGNIFVLYAGNGSLVPPRMNLKEARKREKPIILEFYVDDSKDAKQYALVFSRVQEYYGRAASLIPVNVDTIPVKSSYSPLEPGYYYRGFVPQTVILDQQGKLVFDQEGQVPFEELDDSLREVFDLLPRSESVELKRRSFNEFNGELSK